MIDKKKTFVTLMITLVFSGLLSSCYVKENRFSFDNNGEKVKLYSHFDSKSDRIIYKLKKTIHLSSINNVFYFEYQSDKVEGAVGLSVSVLGEGGKVLNSRVIKLKSVNPVKVEIALDVGIDLWGFTVDRGSDSGIRIIGAGLAKKTNGFLFFKGVLTEGVPLEIENPQIIRNPFLENPDIRLTTDSMMKNKLWQISMVLTDNFNYAEGRSFLPKDISLIVKGRESDKSVLKLMYSGRETIAFLYPAIIDLKPYKLSFRYEQAFEKINGIVGVKAVFLNDLSSWNDMKAIPGDPGVAFYYKKKYWRHKDFEIFRWEKFPGILIMVTANYNTQSSFLKRLAFYVEKKGYAGKFLSDAQLEGKHGYNAHDYRAMDMAIFFNAARKNNIPLNSYEKLLKDLLIENGILRDQGNDVKSEVGGLISFSLSSPPLLRRYLLTHESYHGVFFSSKEYRNSCFKVWESLSDKEREFWKLFLSWRGYDISNSYLLVNEFQAYLFQQKEKEVNRYYKNYIIPRILAVHPEWKERINGFLGKYPDHFNTVYKRLERELTRITGLKGGDVFVFHGLK